MRSKVMSEKKRVRLKIKDLGTTYIPLNAARMPEFVRLNKTPPLVDDEES